MAENGKVTLNTIREFFGYENAGEFRKDWMALDDKSKEQIKEGLGNGSLTY